MHICFIVYSYEDHLKSPEELLDAYYSLRGWCSALAANGCKVSALVRFNQTVQILENNIDYYFCKDSFGPRLSFWQIPVALHQKAIQINADIYHGHNMDKVLQHAHLKHLLGEKRPLIIQNHAETPKKWLKMLLQRLLFKNIDAFLFCAQGQEMIWQKHHLIHKSTHLFYVMEASTDFKYQQRQIARQATGIKGDPVFLWVGNLNENKDPLTILRAFATTLKQQQQAKLYMIFRFDDLMKEVKIFIEQDDLLKKAVHLVGKVDYEDLATYYNSADYFILGSHREGSGYSVMEAMACGCIPIVTNIFSFRMMTNDGAIGFLWEVGDVSTLEIAIQQALAINIEDYRAEVLDFFDRQLSYPAIAKQMRGYYQQMLES